jgi:hypothetical protein
MALDAPGLFVQLPAELDRLRRRVRRAREGNRLRDNLGVGEIGGEALDEVREIRYFLVGEIGPGGHRRVGHAAPDDVDDVLMRRQRSGGRRAHLELAGREVTGLGEQMRGGVALAVAFLAVALRAVPQIELLARLPLRLGPEIRTLCARQWRHQDTQQCGEESDRAARRARRGAEREGGYQARGHWCATSSLARGLWPVKS